MIESKREAVVTCRKRLFPCTVIGQKYNFEPVTLYDYVDPKGEPEKLATEFPLFTRFIGNTPQSGHAWSSVSSALAPVP